ncbi:MAG: efflux RND transporter periplasmic adaptor subunit, partial [Flavobacteriales bacterium]|nr:efflux RND transporter periplasmic adaptor subunit [Flavobacteriales bacterium]
MNKRKVLISLAGAAILLLSFLASGLFKKEAPDRSSSKVDIATAVNAKEVTPGEVNRTVKITGRLLPENTVSLYAEVGGTAQFGNQSFKAGVRFKKGDVLLKINSDEIESGLAAARSSFQSRLAGIIPDLKLDFPDAAEDWEEYLYGMDIEKILPPLPDAGDRQVQLFLSGREIFTTYY